MITPSVVRTVWKQRYTPQKQKSGHHFIYLEDNEFQRWMNKQSGFNVEQIEKDNYLENKTIWRLNLKWQVNTAKQKLSDLQNQQVITREDYIFLKVFHFLHRLMLVVNIQTNHTCHLTSTQLRYYFFTYKVFFLIDSSFVGASVVSRLDMYRTNVLMYHTMVLLACPTNGQTLDVWGDIQQMSTLGWRQHSYVEKSPPQPGMKFWTGKGINRGIRATILVHTVQNKRSFQANANPVRRT